MEAEAELNNVKDKSKYFLLCDEDTFIHDESQKELNLFFNWRALVDEEKKKYGTKNVQETIVSDAVKRLLSEIGEKGSGIELHRKVKEEKTLLEHHLAKYVKKNTTDYFIHKNLKSFLERELDFYIKNEVLDLDEIENMDERRIRLNKAKIRAVRKISRKIIAFLAQIEDFQKMLFEKKKFVLETNFCITLDLIPEHLYSEVGKNEKQIDEWRKQFKLDEMTNDTLYRTEGLKTLGEDFLKSHRHLVVDTTFFNEEFKDRLLQSFDNLEKDIDGILIKSENFQALNLLLNKFRGRVKCVYIDPPYNTGSDEFLYKDNYQHSCWIAMMIDRLTLAHDLLHPSGTIGVSIDNNELDNLLKLMDLIFKHRRAIVTVRRASVTGPKVINPGVVNVAEFLVIYSKSESDWQPNKVYREKKRGKRYNRFILNRDQDPSKWIFTSLLQAFSKQQGIPINRLKKTLGREFEKKLDQFVLDHSDAVVRTAALDDDKISKEARKIKERSKNDPNTIYHFHRENYEDWYIVNGERILFYSDRLIKIGSKIVRGELITDIWDDTLPNDLHNEGGVTLKKGKKPEKLIGRFIELATNEGDLVLDFFAGTGTACAAAQNMKRKWIGVDVADFFNMLLIRRLKNTLNGEQSGISSINNWEGGGFFKYHTLEQYEDSIGNIKFRAMDKTVQETLSGFKDYFLRYMLDYETRESPTRLLVDKFNTPFDYKIKTMSGNEEKEETVNFVETFNYLLGLDVERFRAFKDGERTYRVVFGKRNNKSIVVIWRNMKDLDLEKDKKFIEENMLSGNAYDLIFINGDSYVKNATAIEPEFKKLMGA